MLKLVEVRIVVGEFSLLWELGRVLEKGVVFVEEVCCRVDLWGFGGGYSVWSSWSGGRGMEGWRCLVDWIIW